MFQKNTSGEARVGARDGYNRIVSPHVRLFPHSNSENPSYSLPSTIRCSFAGRSGSEEGRPGNVVSLSSYSTLWGDIHTYHTIGGKV